MAVMTSNGYRLGVGIVLFNDAGSCKGQVFVAQRIDNPEPAWQMPQGGLDKGEQPLSAALRELEEETSIPPQAVEVVAESPDWLTYDFPPDLAARLWSGRFKGQRQKWYLARFTGDESLINLETDHPEFSAWRWVDFAQTPDLIVAFKRPMYQLIHDTFADQLAALLAR